MTPWLRPTGSAQRRGQALCLPRGDGGPLVRSAGQQRSQAFLVDPDGGGEFGRRFGVTQGQTLQADIERQAPPLSAQRRR